jgi:hypothetical protein
LSPVTSTLNFKKKIKERLRISYFTRKRTDMEEDGAGRLKRRRKRAEDPQRMQERVDFLRTSHHESFIRRYFCTEDSCVPHGGIEWRKFEDFYERYVQSMGRALRKESEGKGVSERMVARKIVHESQSKLHLLFYHSSCVCPLSCHMSMSPKGTLSQLINQINHHGKLVVFEMETNCVSFFILMMEIDMKNTKSIFCVSRHHALALMVLGIVPFFHMKLEKKTAMIVLHMKSMRDGMRDEHHHNVHVDRGARNTPLQRKKIRVYGGMNPTTPDS